MPRTTTALLAVWAGLALTRASAEPQRVPPYGVIQFGFGSMTDPGDPWASLGGPPQAGDLWGFNLCRSRQAKGLAQREYSAWSCTHGGSAEIANFGHLVFAGR